jgi:CheY-like chemotaxis protein
VKPVDDHVLLESLKQAGVYPGTGAVLVVDNDPAALKLVSANLDQLGYRAICAQTAEEALELVRIERPAAIVLELLLQRMSGFQFLEELRRTAAGRLIPVIIWTVKDLSLEERRRLRDSAQAIVPRDGTGDLLEQLRPYLTNAHGHKDNPWKDIDHDLRQDIGR